MGKFEYLESNLEQLRIDYKAMSIDDLKIKYNASHTTIQRVCQKHRIRRSDKRMPKDGFSIKYHKIRELEDEFIQDWTEGILTRSELEEKYECPYTNIHSRAVKLEITRDRVVDRIDKDSLISDYNERNMLAKDINNKYNISDSTRLKILHKNDIEIINCHRKYGLNENYFDNIDTEAKAYFLGFIFADGSHNVERYALRICLQQRDEHILKSFYKELGVDKEISYIYNKKYDKLYPYAEIKSKHISERLLELGVDQDKGFKVRFPYYLPDSLTNHFIRGYCDGDGSVSFYKNYPSKLNVSMTGNYDFIKQLEQILLKQTKIEHFSVSKVKRSCVYTLIKGGRFQAQILLDYLYKDSTIYLERKYKKYQQITDYNKETGNARNKFINK